MNDYNKIKTAPITLFQLAPPTTCPLTSSVQCESQLHSQSWG